MFGHQHHDADGGWRGWTEARRFATQLGLSRSFLAQLAKDNTKVHAILDLSPGVQRFLSDANPLIAELQEVLRHMPQRALAAAYRRWATAGHGDNDPPVASRPRDIPVRPEQVYQGYAGPWLTWNDWLGLPVSRETYIINRHHNLLRAILRDCVCLPESGSCASSWQRNLSRVQSRSKGG